jgi:hypothetical protein
MKEETQQTLERMMADSRQHTGFLRQTRYILGLLLLLNGGLALGSLFDIFVLHARWPIRALLAFQVVAIVFCGHGYWRQTCRLRIQHDINKNLHIIKANLDSNDTAVRCAFEQLDAALKELQRLTHL